MRPLPSRPSTATRGPAAAAARPPRAPPPTTPPAAQPTPAAASTPGTRSAAGQRAPRRPSACSRSYSARGDATHGTPQALISSGFNHDLDRLNRVSASGAIPIPSSATARGHSSIGTPPPGGSAAQAERLPRARSSRRASRTRRPRRRAGPPRRPPPPDRSDGSGRSPASRSHPNPCAAARSSGPAGSSAAHARARAGVHVQQCGRRHRHQRRVPARLARLRHECRCTCPPSAACPRCRGGASPTPDSTGGWTDRSSSTSTTTVMPFARITRDGLRHVGVRDPLHHHHVHASATRTSFTVSPSMTRRTDRLPWPTTRHVMPSGGAAARRASIMRNVAAPEAVGGVDEDLHSSVVFRRVRLRWARRSCRLPAASRARRCVLRVG